MRVGDFLRRTRLSPKALRLYGAQGLLVPDRVDPRTGYRQYGAGQVERARLIGVLRAAGMPLATVRAVVDLTGTDRLAAVDAWWAGVEADLRRRRELVAYLHRRAEREDRAAPDRDGVTVREVPAATLLTVERRLTVEALDGFITSAREAIEEQLRTSGAARAGALRVAYHGMVTEDSDGPVEVAVPFTGAVDPADGLRVRRRPPGREALTRLTRAEAEFPRILDAYDVVARWCDDAALTRTGSPAEVYLSARDVAPDEPHLEVAWPVR
nr:MerR family transcriptional regulator [Geodermatophilus sabuli]